MVRSGSVWIEPSRAGGLEVAEHSGASAKATKSKGVTVGFDLNAMPMFANEDEARRCAEEIVALLQRYGLKAEIRWT